MARRVLVAELSHESHTFCPLLTGLEEFHGRWGLVVSGSDLVDRFRGTNTVLGGMLAGAAARGLEVIPSTSAAAYPSGPVTREAYETFAGRILADLEAARPDGVLLSLHGAMVAGGYPDPEADLLARVRGAVGPRVPVVAVLDLHANVSQAMVDAADLLLGYNTYPHVDTGERGEEAARWLAAILAGRVRPVRHLVRPPALLVSMNMRTDAGPMAELFELARAAEGRPGVMDVSLFGGFPYADVPEAGCAVVCAADGDRDLARRVAARLAGELWARRERFAASLPGPEAALRLAMRAPEGPVALADVADNPASGGAGDTPELLRAALRLGVPDALAALYYDPETVALADRLGVGAEGDFLIGGKVYPAHGPPVEVRARVRRLSDGRFTNRGPMGRGVGVDLGRTAVLTVLGGPGVASPPGGVDVVVARSRMSTNDPELFRVLGLEPTARRLLLLKAKGHFRAAFDPIVRQIIDVDAPGFASLDLNRFEYRHVRRPVFPLDPVDWQPPAPATG